MGAREPVCSSQKPQPKKAEEKDLMLIYQAPVWTEHRPSANQLATSDNSLASLSQYVPPHDATPGQNGTQRRSQAASGHEISGACSAKIAVLGSGGHWFRA
jgi:hypothetical protein